MLATYDLLIAFHIGCASEILPSPKPLHRGAGVNWHIRLAYCLVQKLFLPILPFFLVTFPFLSSEEFSGSTHGSFNFKLGSFISACPTDNVACSI